MTGIRLPCSRMFANIREAGKRIESERLFRIARRKRTSVRIRFVLEHRYKQGTMVPASDISKVPWYRLQIRFRIRIRFLDPQYLRFEFDSLSRTTWLFVSFSFRIENRNEFPSLNYFISQKNAKELEKTRKNS